MEFLESAISSLYVAASGQSSWPGALAQLSVAFNSLGAVIASVTERGRLFSGTESMGEIAEAYLAGKWHLLDERYKGVPVLRSQGVAVDSDFISAEGIAKSQYYQDFIIKQGIPWWSGVCVAVDNDIWSLSHLRSPSQGPFLDADKAGLLKIAPHLSRAMMLHKAISSSRTRTMLDMLETMSTASFAIGTNAKVIAFNRLAQSLLGNGLSIVNDLLHAEQITDDLRLQRFLASTLIKRPYAEQALNAIAIRRAGKQPLAIKAISLAERPRSAFEGLAVIIMVTDPQNVPQTDEAMLRSMFTLTAAEAKIAARVADGASLRDVAEELAIEESTARQTFKQVMAKADTHKQGEFIALANRLMYPAIRSDQDKG